MGRFDDEISQNSNSHHDDPADQDVCPRSATEEIAHQGDNIAAQKYAGALKSRQKREGGRRIFPCGHQTKVGGQSGTNDQIEKLAEDRRQRQMCIRDRR